MRALLPAILLACTEPVVIVGPNSDAPVDEVAACWREVAWFGDAGDSTELGRAIAIDGDRLFATDLTANAASWRVHRATMTDDGWRIERNITGADLGAQSTLVYGLALGKDELFLAVKEDEQTGAVWRLSADLTETATVVRRPSVRFGSAIATDGRHLMVGDPGPDARAVYVFALDAPGAPKLAQVLQSPRDTRFDRFGAALALRGDRLLVGAPACPNPVSFENCRNSGAVDEFARTGNEWTWVRTIAAPDRAGRFGAALAFLDHDRFLIGAPHSYACVERCYATATNLPGLGAGGCPGDQRPCPFAGAIYVATSTSIERVRSEELVPNDIYNTQWGTSLAVTERWVAVGASHESSCSVHSPLSTGCSTTGAVLLFRRDGSALIPTRYLKPRDLDVGGYFGEAIALSDRWLVVGAHLHCGMRPAEECSRSGAVYVYAACE